MAFTAEDGTGVTGANAYIDVAFADDYFSDRGNATWTALTTTQKEQAIVRASDYLEWRFKYKGYPKTSTQGLRWPRSGVYDELGNEVEYPENVQKACAEYSVRASSQTLAPDPEIDDSGRPVTMTKDKVDVIEEQRKFSDEDTSVRTIKPYPEADNLLKDYILSTDRLLRM